MLSNAYFLAKVRFDTAENEPAKNLQKIANFSNPDPPDPNPRTLCTPEVRWDEESPNDLVAEAAADPRAAIDEARRTAGEVGKNGGGPPGGLGLGLAKLANFVNFSRARSRLYRNELLQVNMRWKALAEIYTMHSFALL